MKVTVCSFTVSHIGSCLRQWVVLALSVGAFASWTGCHVTTSGSFTAESSSSAEGDADFRIHGSTRVQAGDTLVIWGDFSGVAVADVSIDFEGVSGRVAPQSVTSSEIRIIVPAGARSGRMRVYIRGELRWTTTIHIRVVMVGRARPPAPKAPPPIAPVPEAPPPAAPAVVTCSVSPSIATTDTSIDVLGRFPQMREKHVTFQFTGVKKPTRVSRIQPRRISVTVPKDAKTGRLAVLDQGREVCAVDLTIAKKDDGLLADAPVGRGLVGNIYKLRENTQALPDFDKMTPLGSIVVPNIAVAPRAFETGFPGVNVEGSQLVEWFGIRFEGALLVDREGAYQFEVNSDDGARVYIDGQPVVANDGIHPPSKVTGEATLSKGEHRIRIDYYQGPRVLIALELRWKGPGEEALTIIPKSAFRRGMGTQ